MRTSENILPGENNRSQKGSRSRLPKHPDKVRAQRQSDEAGGCYHSGAS